MEVLVQQALSGTGGGDRTRTALSGHGILSPGRLPISPPRPKRPQSSEGREGKLPRQFPVADAVRLVRLFA